LRSRWLNRWRRVGLTGAHQQWQDGRAGDLDHVGHRSGLDNGFVRWRKGDTALAASIREFQFRDIRPKAASEIELDHASRLLGHSTEEMTRKVYRRVGEIVRPTK